MVVLAWSTTMPAVIFLLASVSWLC